MNHPQWNRNHQEGKELHLFEDPESSMQQLWEESTDPSPGSSEHLKQRDFGLNTGLPSFKVQCWNCFCDMRHVSLALGIFILICNVGQSVPLSSLNIQIPREPWASGLFMSPGPLSFSSIITSKWKSSLAASGSFGWSWRVIQLLSGPGAQIRQGGQQSGARLRSLPFL